MKRGSLLPQTFKTLFVLVPQEISFFCFSEPLKQLENIVSLAEAKNVIHTPYYTPTLTHPPCTEASNSRSGWEVLRWTSEPTTHGNHDRQVTLLTVLFYPLTPNPCFHRLLQIGCLVTWLGLCQFLWRVRPLELSTACC